MKQTFKCVLRVLCAFLPLTAFANLNYAPANFKIPEGLAVFVDFQSAEYNISFNGNTKKVTVVSKIVFENLNEGYPIFDIVDEPSQIVIDGEVVTSKVIKTPEDITKVRVAMKSLKPGTHTFEIHSVITKGIKFMDDGVSAAFWFSDLSDRSYLEAYLPANYEFDQHKINFNLEYINLPQQKIYTNGDVVKIDNSRSIISFPETYTSSSLYFQTAPVGRYPELNFNIKSIDGRMIPVVLYANSTLTNLETTKLRVIKSIEGLESKYGPYLHKTLTIFIAGSGGMEYCGATMTDIGALNHELIHSYFARGGFMPSNGNAGWIDEAITSWSDGGSYETTSLGNLSSNMAGHSQYKRSTDMDAYSKGKTFMSYLHYKFKNSGGLTSFLNRLIQDDSFKPMTTEDFIKKMSTYYSEDVTPLFRKHIYSKNKSGKGFENIPHMKMTIDEMASLL